MYYSVMTQAYSEKEIPSSPNRSRTYNLPITSSDALPLSYRRLVEAKAIKLGSITFPLIAHMPLIDIQILAGWKVIGSTPVWRTRNFFFRVCLCRY